MVKAFIEIASGSKYKYELDKQTNTLVLDRPLNQFIPANYGFIPETLSEDGDPLDVFVITDEPLVPGTICKVNLIGIMFCKDNGIPDHKLVATLKDNDMEAHWGERLDLIVNYLKTYKINFKYESYANEQYALLELDKCQKAYMSNKLQTISNTSKI